MSENKNLSTFLKFMLVITLSVWVTGYLMASFVDWSWLNPVQYIVDLPDMSRAERADILASGFLIYLLICTFSGVSVSWINLD